MRTYHHNGEHWYRRDWSLWHHIRHWLVWVGGWEKANGEGWELTRSYLGKRRLADPTPISLFGHRFTHYGWGWNLRVAGGYLVCVRDGGPGRPGRMYVSANGTPDRATTWFYGEPPEVRAEAEQSRRDLLLRRALREAHP